MKWFYVKAENWVKQTSVGLGFRMHFFEVADWKSGTFSLPADMG